jgi:hypothetical protein
MKVREKKLSVKIKNVSEILSRAKKKFIWLKKR